MIVCASTFPLSSRRVDVSEEDPAMLGSEAVTLLVNEGMAEILTHNTEGHIMGIDDVKVPGLRDAPPPGEESADEADPRVTEADPWRHAATPSADARALQERAPRWAKAAASQRRSRPALESRGPQAPGEPQTGTGLVPWTPPLPR